MSVAGMFITMWNEDTNTSDNVALRSRLESEPPFEEAAFVELVDVERTFMPCVQRAAAALHEANI